MSDKRQNQSRPTRHPQWCDQALCTASETAELHGAHRSAPTSRSLRASAVEVSASLHQSHAPWLTAQFMDIEFDGLRQDWMPAKATLHLRADEALDLFSALADLARVAVEDEAAQAEADYQELVAWVRRRGGE